MANHRIELANGGWLECTPHMTFNQQQAISRAGGEDPAELTVALIETTVTEWSVTDWDGKAIRPERADIMGDKTHYRTIEEIVQKLSAFYRMGDGPDFPSAN